MRWTVVRTIDALPDRVFRVVADPDAFNEAIPDGVGVERQEGTGTGAGMKFRSTRLLRGKPQVFEQEVTEFVPGERVRMINVTGATLWDSTFQVAPDGTGATILTLTMDAVSDRLLARVMNRLIAPMVRRALHRDMDAVKAYCERSEA